MIYEENMLLSSTKNSLNRGVNADVVKYRIEKRVLNAELVNYHIDKKEHARHRPTQWFSLLLLIYAMGI